MTVGLDLGGSQFRSLRRQGNRLVARACRAVYAVVLDNPARRALFSERRIPFAEFGSNLILFGDAAEEWSTRLRVSAIPLVVNNRLQLEDRVIRQVISALIESLLPAPERAGDDCCLTLPGGMDGSTPEAVEYLIQIVRSFGFHPRIAGSGLAVALSEMAPLGMSGLGICLGESRCDFSVVRQGRELTRIELARGVDLQRAIPGISDDAVAAIPLGAEESLREIFATAAFELNRRPEWKALVPPVSLAVAGEILATPSLAALVPICLQHASWPFALGGVHIPADPQWSVSRGCLIQAELEALTTAIRPAA